MKTNDRNVQFDVMGARYVQSLERFPHARDAELELLRAHVPSTSAPRLLDYACGSGFLTSFLRSMSHDSTVEGVDASREMLSAYRASFADSRSIRGMHVDDFLTTHGGRYDACLSLGGFHHILDQVATISSIADRMRPGASITFADFEDGTASQAYFDSLIHENNGFGHTALFVSESRAINIARACGLEMTEYRREKIFWRFADRGSITDFVKLHHGLSCDSEFVDKFLESSSMLCRDGDDHALLHDYAVFSFCVKTSGSVRR